MKYSIVFVVLFSVLSSSCYNNNNDSVFPTNDSARIQFVKDSAHISGTYSGVFYRTTGTAYSSPVSDTSIQNVSLTLLTNYRLVLNSSMAGIQNDTLPKGVSPNNLYKPFDGYYYMTSSGLYPTEYSAYYYQSADSVFVAADSWAHSYFHYSFFGKK